MAFATTTFVGPQVVADGATPLARSARDAAQVFYEGGGKYGEPTRLGQMFTYSTPAAGVAIPIYTSTTQQCVFWNPLGNSVPKAIKIRRIILGYVSGTEVAGHYCLATQTLQTNAISGTQSALVQGNKLTGNYNANGQNGQAGQLLTAATVVAGTYFRPLRLSQVAMTAAGVVAAWIFDEEIDDSLIVMPGGAFWVAANVAAAVTAVVAIETTEVALALCA